MAYGVPSDIGTDETSKPPRLQQRLPLLPRAVVEALAQRRRASSARRRSATRVAGSGAGGGVGVADEQEAAGREAGGDAVEERFLGGGGQVVQDVEQHDVGGGGAPPPGGRRGDPRDLDVSPRATERLPGGAGVRLRPSIPNRVRLGGGAHRREAPGRLLLCAAASRASRMPRPQPRSRRRPERGSTPWRRRSKKTGSWRSLPRTNSQWRCRSRRSGGPVSSMQGTRSPAPAAWRTSAVGDVGEEGAEHHSHHQAAQQEVGGEAATGRGADLRDPQGERRRRRAASRPSWSSASTRSGQTPGRLMWAAR